MTNKSLSQIINEHRLKLMSKAVVKKGGDKLVAKTPVLISRLIVTDPNALGTPTRNYTGE
ncbi:MAG: hypothetical protein BGO01_03635 [Armatimonadetes bacterium 55-13]|nr:hypothetical protein [Armatimonadota bacterium]OJU63039.1 MAG: hypothetical protein BGO01_03635 [Armatimonadetes bacterium 55-13]